jgi:hypothetical protein
MNQEQLNEQLYKAIKAGDLNLMKESIKKGAQVNSEANPNSHGQCIYPLHYAALIGYGDGVKLLLKRGARVNLANDIGVTALHLAAGGQCEKTVELLLQNGADITLKNKSGETPLHWGAIRGGKVLIKHTVLQNPETEKPDYITNNSELSKHWDDQVKKEIFLLNNQGIFNQMSRHSGYVINRDVSLDSLISDAKNFLNETQKKFDAEIDFNKIIEHRVDKRYPASLKAAAFGKYEEGVSRALEDPSVTQKKVSKAI